jgi:hypothetical protein
MWCCGLVGEWQMGQGHAMMMRAAREAPSAPALNTLSPLSMLVRIIFVDDLCCL